VTPDLTMKLHSNFPLKSNSILTWGKLLVCGRYIDSIRWDVSCDDSLPDMKTNGYCSKMQA